MGGEGFPSGAATTMPPPGPDSETADELLQARTHLSFEVLGCPGKTPKFLHSPVSALRLCSSRVLLGGLQNLSRFGARGLAWVLALLPLALM